MPALSANPTDHNVVQYCPFREATEIQLSPALIYVHFARPTKTGVRPNRPDCLRFLNLCRAKKLNPWAGDCVLSGYDTSHGARFEPIVTLDVLLERAESNEQFDGLAGGVLVDSDRGIGQRVGAFATNDETIVGGWAKVHRKDRSHPTEVRVRLATYRTQARHWTTDAAGMITNVARAAVLREAFPNLTGGLFIAEEREHAHQSAGIQTTAHPFTTVPPFASAAVQNNRTAGVARQLNISNNNRNPHTHDGSIRDNKRHRFGGVV